MRIVSVRNPQYIKVKRCCASCQHKSIEKDGTRVCELMQLVVGQMFRCKQWQMNDSLEKAGLLTGGVVRLKGTTEVIIQ